VATPSALGSENTGISGRARPHDTCRPGSAVMPTPEAARADCDVLIVSHTGGWGNMPLRLADDLRPVVLGIREHLESRGLRTCLSQHNRLPQCPLPCLVITAELCGLHNTYAPRYARRLESVLRRHPRLQVVMVGLSNGAAFANGVMTQLEDWAFERVVSVECGPPFYHTPLESDRILPLTHIGEDPLSQGELGLIVGTGLTAAGEMAWSWLSGRPLTLTEALSFTSHGYTWPSIGPTVTEFLDRWLDGRAASPDNSGPGQE
jgi:hypothetical protein